jgi:acyl-CoA synthetase (AMP-forming)/AMP-acid ligase II
MELPGVRAVCVFGVPDPEWGEAVRAVVEAGEGDDLTEQGVIDHVSRRIARFKRPKRVRFAGALPRGAAGELDRDAIKQQFQAD